MRLLRYVASLLSVLVVTPAALAWNHTGHRVVATIAYDELSPATRQRVDALLRAHPRYHKDLLEMMPEGYDREARFAFGIAGFWPDIIRNQRNPMHFTHHRPQWHGIHVRYELPDWKPATPSTRPVQTNPSPPKPAIEEKDQDPKNVVEAIAKCKADLRDPAVSDADKAIAICWLAHLVGDIHQPLHATTLFSAQFPDGDNAANRFMVLHRGGPDNLHRVWDQILGVHDSMTIVNYLADAIFNDPRLQPDSLPEVSNLKTEAWVAESHALGKSVVHRNGKLEGVNSDVLRDNPDMAVPALPPGYIRDAEEVAVRRMALAGRRLAAVLNETLGEQPKQ